MCSSILTATERAPHRPMRWRYGSFWLEQTARQYLRGLRLLQEQTSAAIVFYRPKLKEIGNGNDS